MMDDGPDAFATIILVGTTSMICFSGSFGSGCFIHHIFVCLFACLTSMAMVVTAL